MRSYEYQNLRFPLREEANDYLPRLWATRRVGWLMEQVRTNGEQRELRDEIVDLGTRYGIVTPYTSYLALEGRETTQLVPQPRSVNGRATGIGGNIMNAPKGALDAPVAESITVVGEEAVKQSKLERLQKEADRIDEVEAKDTRAMKRVSSKTFYLRDGVWSDADFKADAGLPETTVTFGSDAYFELLNQKPKLAEYFALGERIVVVFEGRVYRVNAATH
jgi:Ca-activated chloride channel family protein